FCSADVNEILVICRTEPAHRMAGLTGWPGSPDEGDPPVPVVELVDHVCEALLGEHPLEGHGLERRVDDEHLVLADLGGDPHDLLERFTALGEGRPRIDDPGTAGDVHRPLLGPLLDVGPAELAGPGRVEL